MINYTVAQNEQTKPSLKIQTQIIAFEFEKQSFPTIEDIKKFVKTDTSFGHQLKFDTVVEADTVFGFQQSKVFKPPVKQLREKIQEGIYMVIHICQYRLKDDNLTNYKKYQSQL